MNALFVLTGPSCAGKSPLVKAARQHYPNVLDTFKPVVLYTSRPPRPGERDGRDYHFRPRETIQNLGTSDHIRVFEVRGDLQAVDLKDLQENSKKTNLLYEGNPKAARLIVETARDFGIRVTSVFLSPLSGEEFHDIIDSEQVIAPQVVTEIMRRKLLRRTRTQKGDLSLDDLQTIERRAQAAYEELLTASFFDCVLPNHDGEDSENWNAFPLPLGDARTSIQAFMHMLTDRSCSRFERWN